MFVGVKMLGFTEKEVGHFTFKKWFMLFEEYKKYHNFKIRGYIFKDEKTSAQKTESLWIPFDKFKK